ncbi:MAG: helix-turn-helix domain-containing protein [Chitinophagaceae bacterium]|nr:helix-turn-helix domain-containing protein [Chitinophagaceae bacterium]
MKLLSIIVPNEQSNMSTIACIVGTLQLFNEANNLRVKQHKQALFKVILVGADLNNAVHSDMLFVKPSHAISSISKTDLIVIPATNIKSYETATKGNKLLIQWIAQQYNLGAEVASMCIGSFMLASTGLLNGKTCSTHWALTEQFKLLHPEVNLKPDKLITDEHGIYTNGGAYSFLNLLLYLIEKFYDRATAVHCAKYFQIDIDRNRQSEFSIFNGHKQHQDDDILKAQIHIELNYQDKISMEALSQQLNIGRRNFDRRFIKATGLSPLEYLQRVRIEAAKRMFETSRKTVSEVMFDTGYSDNKAFRELFGRFTGLSPLEYKTKYNRERAMML